MLKRQKNQQANKIVPPLNFSYLKRRNITQISKYRDYTKLTQDHPIENAQASSLNSNKIVFVGKQLINDNIQRVNLKSSDKNANYKSKQLKKQQNSEINLQKIQHNQQKIDQQCMQQNKKQKYFTRKKRSSRLIPINKLQRQKSQNNSCSIKIQQSDDQQFISIQNYTSANNCDNLLRSYRSVKLLTETTHQNTKNQKLTNFIQEKDAQIQKLNNKILQLEKQNAQLKKQNEYINTLVKRGNKNIQYFMDQIKNKIQIIKKLQENMKYLQIKNHVLEKIKVQFVRSNQNIVKLQKQNRVLSLKIQYLYKNKNQTFKYHKRTSSEWDQISLSLSDEEKSIQSISTNQSPRDRNFVNYSAGKIINKN